MTDLVGLARRFVQLSELEATRAEIAKAVLNGGGGASPKAPFTPAGRPGRTGSLGGKSQSQPLELQSQPNQHPNAIRGAEVETQILAMLKERPHRMAEISSTMKSRQSTTSERLRRMRAKGLVERRGEGWAIVASAAPG